MVVIGDVSGEELQEDAQDDNDGDEQLNETGLERADEHSDIGRHDNGCMQIGGLGELGELDELGGFGGLGELGRFGGLGGLGGFGRFGGLCIRRSFEFEMDVVVAAIILESMNRRVRSASSLNN